MLKSKAEETEQSKSLLYVLQESSMLESQGKAVFQERNRGRQELLYTDLEILSQQLH